MSERITTPEVRRRQVRGKRTAGAVLAGGLLALASYGAVSSMSDSEKPQGRAADQTVPTTETTAGAPEVDVERQKQIEEYDRAVEQELRMPIIETATTMINNPQKFPNVDVSISPEKGAVSTDGKTGGGYGSIVSITRNYTDGSTASIEFRRVPISGYYSDEQIGVEELSSAQSISIEKSGPEGSAPSTSDNPRGRSYVGVTIGMQGLVDSGKYYLNGDTTAEWGKSQPGNYYISTNEAVHVIDGADGVARIDMTNALKEQEAARFTVNNLLETFHSS